MAKEIADIIIAYHEAQRAGRKTALATVVHVEGSSYRMPGARMLVEDNGMMTGAISGGCLEGDALRKALQAINQHSNKLVTYNTLDDDDLAFGVQLGCNGIVHILFEPIDPGQPNNPVALLEKFYKVRKNAVVVTIYSLTHPAGPQPGTSFFINQDNSASTIADTGLAVTIGADATSSLANAVSILKDYPDYNLSAFYELLQPPVSLVIVGAGNDAMPLANMAKILGWSITIVDGRPTHANSLRFPRAEKIIVGKPADALTQVLKDDRTVFVLLTHNYNYDLAMLKILLGGKSKYIGTLGPKKRLERMLGELQEQGTIITDEQKERIYGPTGLDIGAETPEEIALSVVAEIKAVLAGHPGTFLRTRAAAIHSRPSQQFLPNTF